MKVVDRAFYCDDPRVVAPQLLNKLLIRGERVARIVEVEAYLGSEDPAAHTYRGRTPRNATMFGKPGHLYVYFSYGMHWCANAVCGEEGQGWAVLLRAAAPVGGLEAMRAARPAARRDLDLCRGPGRLGQAFGFTRADDGADLVSGDRDVVIGDDGVDPPARPGCSTRVGLTKAADLEWRWFVDGDPHVSALRAGGRARPTRPLKG